MKLIKYSDFLRITNNQQIVEGLKITRGGIWRDAAAFHHVTFNHVTGVEYKTNLAADLTGEEAAALEWEPDGDWEIGKPLVEFPCTLQALIQGLGPYSDVIHWDIAIEYSTPIWEKWHSAEKIKIWEAVALTLGIEPTLITSDINAWASEKSFNISDVHTVFRQRLTYALKNNVAHIEEAPSSDRTPGNVYKCKISLREFVKFVSSTSWEVPSKLTDLLTPLDSMPTQVDATAKNPPQKVRRIWDDYSLLRLLDEYEQPGITHQKLAEKYGVKRQFIGKQLKLGESLRRRPKAQFTDPLNPRRRK